MRAAVEVIGEEGYDGASMRDMAARAGVSVAALYHHFPSKHDLLRAFLDEAWDVILARLDRRMAEAPDAPQAQLDEIVSTLIASNLHDDFARCASRVAYNEHPRLDPPERAGIVRKHKRLLGITERVIVEGVKSGDFTTREPREAARAILLLSTTLAESYGDTGYTMQELIEIYQRFAHAIVRT